MRGGSGFGVGEVRSLRLEPLEDRSLLSAGGLGVQQIPLELPYYGTDWYEPHISDDGLYAAISTTAPLVPEDLNNQADVYLIDLQTNELTWVSKPEDGSQPGAGSWKPEISPDGRYVAFMSMADNLLAVDQDPSIDLFVYDRQTAMLECVTADQDGDALSPQFSGDGTKIVYEFEFNDDVPTDPNAPTKDIVLLDRTTGERIVVTEGLDGAASDGISWRPHISHDGQFVVFQSTSSNLVANDSNATWDVFLYDVASDNMECLSVNADGDPANSMSRSVRISGDGRYATFQSSATDLTAANENGVENIYLLDRVTNELVSIAGDGFPDGATCAERPDISTDGRYIVYHGSSTSGSETSPTKQAEVYVYDRVTGQTQCVTTQADVTASGATSAYASISGDGESIVFLSDADNLTSGLAPDSMDLFVATNPFALPSGYDYGDAPISYVTSAFANGARHLAVGPTLGEVRDSEYSGTASENADGDDNTGEPDDEDGVVFGTVQVGSLDATATVTVDNAPDGAKLDAWIDFNGDGSWSGADERIACSVAVVEGANTITFDVPSGALPGETYARFRLSTDGVSAPTGAADDGEVEDYLITLDPAATGSGFFVPRETIAGDLAMPFAVCSADLDGDGDQDVLVASPGNDRVLWYENRGNGVFAGHTISASIDSVGSVSAADLDGDGDIDVLAASANDNEVVWFANEGSGNFSEALEIGYARTPRSVIAVDIDQDGDMDVLCASSEDNRITWFENDGAAHFSDHRIDDTARGAWSVFATDLDGDDDIDLVLGSAYDDTVSWYENNGDNEFTAHTITTSADWVCSVSAADLDGDGDMDVLSASRDDNTIAWYENNGSEQFTAHVISNTSEQPISLYASDLDGDGDIDVLSASTLDGTIAWYENDGDAEFVDHTIATGAVGPHSVWAVDLDGDAEVDVLSASKNDSTIDWYENDGSEQFLAHFVATSAIGARSVCAADLDQDGDMDVLSASATDDKIAWYENDGQGWFTSHTITTSADGAWMVQTADLDGDGDLDVLSASVADDRIAWYENDGAANFSEHTVTVAADGARSVFAADLDGDGDMDVLSGSSNDDKIAWYENDGAGNFIAHVISESAPRASSVSAADLDGDGDVDVVSASQGQYEITWYENDGNGGFVAQRIAIVETGADYVTTADVDSDGDLDLVASAWSHGTVSWYENDGNADFSFHELSTDSPDASSVFASDIDGDGDMDVLATSSQNGRIAWYENDGEQTFVEHTITDAANWARSAFAADVDGDGDLDALSASVVGAKITWYEQVAASPQTIGEVDWRELSGLDLTSGNKLYSFTAARAGYLSTDATFDPAGGEAMLRLFDDAGNLVAEATRRDGHARFDYANATAGAEYLLEVRGANPQVDVRICNMVENVSGVVTVYGTTEADDFEYIAGARHLVGVNSFFYSFDSQEIRSIYAALGKGVDRATITGSTEGEEALLSPGRGSLSNVARGFSVGVHNAAAITINGGGGGDTVELTDSNGDDQLTISPGRAEMAGRTVDGTSYTLAAVDFPVVFAYARGGGSDSAVLQSSEPGRVKVYPEIVKLVAPDGYGRVKFFGSTTVEMLADDDTGVVIGSSSQDALWATSGEARVAYDIDNSSAAGLDFAALAYDVTILGCERLTARADGSDDWLQLHDSALNDVLIAKPHKTLLMNGPRADEGIARGDEYEICARGYLNVMAIADGGGENDVAKLYDSAEDGVDVWAAGYVDGAAWSSMSSPSQTLYEVEAFERIGGYGFNGGLGEDFGINRKDHAAGTDFVFQNGYWED